MQYIFLGRILIREVMTTESCAPHNICGSRKYYTINIQKYMAWNCHFVKAKLTQSGQIKRTRF